jgi:ATP-dependent RNA helicase DDX35
MAFWKPGTIAPGSNIAIENDEENLIIYNPYDNKISINQQKINLPVYKNKIHILYLVEKYQVVIVVGQTGSGKTTQIPQYLYEAGWTSNGKMIACVQPRRVAATTMADRVAKEMGVKLGFEVGYSVRFDEKYDEVLTKIKYMTDGMLFREMMIDPLLSRYSVIMIDEAHERSIHTDLIIGLIKKYII